MRHPVIYSPLELKTWHVDCEVKPGVWRPARPCGFWNWRGCWRMHLSIVWGVLIGRLDAINWDADCQGSTAELRHAADLRRRVTGG